MFQSLFNLGSESTPRIINALITKYIKLPTNAQLTFQ